MREGQRPLDQPLRQRRSRTFDCRRTARRATAPASDSRVRGWRCDADAVEAYDGANWCEDVWPSNSVLDAIDDAFVNISTLMDWLRANVKPPPADLLYEAADATERLRAIVKCAMTVSNRNPGGRRCGQLLGASLATRLRAISTLACAAWDGFATKRRNRARISERLANSVAVEHLRLYRR